MSQMQNPIAVAVDNIGSSTTWLLPSVACLCSSVDIDTDPTSLMELLDCA